VYLKTRSHHVNDDLTKYGFLEICCISSMADFTQLYTYLKNQNPSSCASVARQTNKTWIVNIPHFADMDRRFWFYPLMCVAYLQIKNFVTCWFLDMFHLQRAKYISKTNCNTVFCIFLRCTQGTMHLKTMSCHVNDNLTKDGLSDMLRFVRDRPHPNYTHISKTQIHQVFLEESNDRRKQKMDCKHPRFCGHGS